MNTQNSNSTLFLILFALSISISGFGQKAHYFKPWKSAAKYDNKQIIFLIDTAGSADDIKVLLIMASKIDDNLKNEGIKTKPIPFPTDTVIDSNTLCLKLQNLKMAYVKLNTLESKIPLCFRVRITQTQPKSKRIIETDISISVDKKQQGVDEFGKEFAKKLLVHFKSEN